MVRSSKPYLPTSGYWSEQVNEYRRTKSRIDVNPALCSSKLRAVNQRGLNVQFANIFATLGSSEIALIATTLHIGTDADNRMHLHLCANRFWI